MQTEIINRRWLWCNYLFYQLTHRKSHCLQPQRLSVHSSVFSSPCSNTVSSLACDTRTGALSMSSASVVLSVGSSSALISGCTSNASIWAIVVGDAIVEQVASVVSTKLVGIAVITGKECTLLRNDRATNISGFSVRSASKSAAVKSSTCTVWRHTLSRT